VETIAATEGVAPYFDLSFQHSSESVLRRMRRFGSTERFLGLLDSVRAITPEAGARSNVIVGFPGETRADVAELERFLSEARLDAIGVFDYSDEDGTEAAGLPNKVAKATIARRYAKLSALAEELCNQRAEERIGSIVDVLVESGLEGRSAHQAPDVDGSTTLTSGSYSAGDLVRARVTATDGVDLVAIPLELLDAPSSLARP
jgi:ribosomal protein S12 methylthiotransferase